MVKSCSKSKLKDKASSLASLTRKIKRNIIDSAHIKDLKPRVEDWSYLAEGKNHVIYSNKSKPVILRLRKCQNQKYYDDPLLSDEFAYNQLFFQNILMKQCRYLSKFVDHTVWDTGKLLKKKDIQSIVKANQSPRIQKLIAQQRISKKSDVNSNKEFKIDMNYPPSLMEDF